MKMFHNKKYLVTALLQFQVEALDPGEAMKKAEKVEIETKLGNLSELKSLITREL